MPQDATLAPTHHMTRGQQVTGADFNPSQKPEVDQIKGSTAALIDVLDHLMQRDGNNPEATRCAKIASQKYEEACMFAVKALTR